MTYWTNRLQGQALKRLATSTISVFRPRPYPIMAVIKRMSKYALEKLQQNEKKDLEEQQYQPESKDKVVRSDNSIDSSVLCRNVAVNCNVNEKNWTLLITDGKGA